jgi:hypothetical protein
LARSFTSTDVCRRWRQTAIADSTFCAYITSNMGQQWICEILTRSRSTPILVDLNGHDLTQEPPELLEHVITTHLHHITELYIKRYSLHRNILPLFQSLTPIMKALDLQVYFSCDDGHGNVDAHHFPQLPEKALVGNCLRYLSLYNISPPWQTFSANLEELKIELESLCQLYRRPSLLQIYVITTLELFETLRLPPSLRPTSICSWAPRAHKPRKIYYQRHSITLPRFLNPYSHPTSVPTCDVLKWQLLGSVQPSRVHKFALSCFAPSTTRAETAVTYWGSGHAFQSRQGQRRPLV